MATTPFQQPSSQPGFGTVQLNVGGVHFSTTRETLVRCPNSMLAAMFSGRHEQQLDDLGRVFIDRDGVRFRHVLNFLRSGTMPCFDAVWRYEEVVEEADFFALEDLRQYAMEQVEILKKAAQEKENRDKAHQEQQHLNNLAKYSQMASTASTTFSNVDVSNLLNNNHNNGRAYSPDRETNPPQPLISPTLNFTLEEDF